MTVLNEILMFGLFPSVRRTVAFHPIRVLPTCDVSKKINRLIAQAVLAEIDRFELGFNGFDDRHWPTELLGIGHPVVDRLERSTLVQVRRMHRVAGVVQRGGKTAHGLGEPQSVVKHDDLSHGT